MLSVSPCTVNDCCEEDDVFLFSCLCFLGINGQVIVESDSKDSERTVSATSESPPYFRISAAAIWTSSFIILEPLDGCVNFLQACRLIKVRSSGKLRQKVYKCGISGADVVEKIAQMLGPSGKDSLLVFGQCVAIFVSHGVHRVVRGAVGCLDCIIKLLRRIGVSMGLNLFGLRQPPVFSIWRNSFLTLERRAFHS